jgi:hypothetical protein
LRQLAENIGEVFWMIDLAKREVLAPMKRFGVAPVRACWNNRNLFSTPFIRTITRVFSKPNSLS